MKGLRNIEPYTAGEQPNFPDMIKINTNENAYPPAPAVFEQLKTFDAADLRLYSSLTNTDLKKSLSEVHQLSSENFIIGNGSDEILAFCMLAFFNSKDPILFPDITYGFYKVWADLFHIPFKEIPLDSNFEIDFSKYSIPNGGILFANPNAPTGIYKNQADIEELLEKNSESIIVIDETYCNFGSSSLKKLIHTYENLVITHTLSKSHALAGLRIGYAISNPKLIAILESVKSSFNPYSVDKLAEALATAAVEAKEYYEVINKQIIETREYFIERLTNLGFSTLPSQTNFVLTTHATLNSKNLFDYLESQHVFVRHFTSPERLNSYLRISIGTQEEMQQVVKKISEFMQKK